MNKIAKFNVAQQFAALKRYYNFGETKITAPNTLSWQGNLRSSPLGDEYLIRVDYKKGENPNIFVLEPKVLKLPEGKNKLEHVFDQKKQRLCLFYRKEWNDTKTLASTIFPWIIEWLYHYETWIITGDWLGGGIHVGDKNLK